MTSVHNAPGIPHEKSSTVNPVQGPGTVRLLRRYRPILAHGQTSMTLHSAVEQEIRELIREDGRITFAQFMQAALYSRRGGFYASDARIDAHFGTSAMTHPAFGALIARQLSEMWHLLGEPRVFDVIEVGSSDGSLARSIVDACRRTAPDFAEALRYVAADYEPRGPRTHPDIQRVKAEGLAAFRNVVGCILSNELIDNFPVHRFAVRDGRIEEIFVTVENGELAEVLVVLTIDYGGTAGELYSGDRDTLVCYHRHAVRQDPYRDIGRQDVTCHVDFTSRSQDSPTLNSERR
jgi:SAM-dependent MidA family methyltransferase